MKKIITILLVALCSVATLSAQEKKQQRMSPEEYKQRQQEFITQRAGLSDSEAEAFFPVYFQLQKEKMDLHHATISKVRKPKGEEPTEEEASRFVDEMADLKIKCDQLEKDYIRQFKQMLPASKLLKVQMAERDFQRELMRNLEHGRNGRKPSGNPANGNHPKRKGEKKAE